VISTNLNSNFIDIKQKQSSPFVIKFHLPIPGSSTSSEYSSSCTSTSIHSSRLTSPFLVSSKVKLEILTQYKNESDHTSIPSPLLNTNKQNGHTTVIKQETNSVLCQLQKGFPSSPLCLRPRIPVDYTIMSDNEGSTESSGWAEDSSATKTDTEDEAEDSTGYNEEENSVNDTVKSFNYTDLAMSLLSSGNEKFNLSKEEENLIQDSTVNTKKYGRTKLGIETRFFDTIQQYGGPELQPLLEIVETKKIKERQFYIVLRSR
jgi:hypothetical protein